MQALVDETVARLGRLDVLVNSASLWRKTPWAELDESAWDQLVDIALKGPFLCAKAAAPHLTAHGDGAIINIADLSAYIPFPGYMPHSAAKAGLVNLTYSLAMDSRRPCGSTPSRPARCSRRPITPRSRCRPGQTHPHRPLGHRRRRRGRAVFLVQAPYITGVILPVDGGERLARR